MVTPMMFNSMKLYCLLILLLSSCTVEKFFPDPLHSQPIIDVKELAPCDWHELHSSKKSLLDGLYEINIQVQTPIEEVKDDIVLQFDWEDGLAKGIHSKKIIHDVVLTTGEDGAQYEIVYEPVNGFHETLGVWFNWNETNSIPQSDFLVNDIGNINLNPDGAILYRIHKDIRVPSKGVAMLVCGIGGMEYASRQLGNALLEDGWTVAYLFSVITTPDIGQNIPIDGTPESLIELFNHKYCQLMSAAQAIQRSLDVTDCSQFILLGISAGALNTPAIYEALLVKPECVVLIAGGANMAEIVQEGVVTNWDFVVDGKFLSLEERQMLSDQYLTHLSRDPYHLSALLPHKKTLLLHAKWDKIVPAENGDLLWEQSGQTERWVYPSGHLGLFATFHNHAHKIVEWIKYKLQQ